MTDRDLQDKSQKGVRQSTSFRVMQVLYILCMLIGIVGYIDTREPRLLIILLALFIPGLVMWIKIPAKYRRMEDEQFASEERELKGK